jgi:hypothetical protein
MEKAAERGESMVGEQRPLLGPMPQPLLPLKWSVSWDLSAWSVRQNLPELFIRQPGETRLAPLDGA